MKLGMNLRNWGPNGTPETITACAQAADQSTLDSIWINDHIGFPPGDWNNEYGIPDEMGSILDPLGVLTYIAAVTTRVSIGTGVLLAPYRPPLLTAKWLATIQVLSNERYLMGVGPGYLTEEFVALGVPKSRRGKITDETLEFIKDAFDNGAIESNGQKLVFAPCPKRPPFYIGGNPDIAIPRAVRIGDGWIPVSILPEDLAPHISRMHELAEEADRGKLETVIMKTLPLEDGAQAIELAQAYRDAGVDHLVHTQGYAGAGEYQAVVARLTAEIQPAV
jgi:probable F420-dependent oxidoreductase